jgi:hypothetical protein
LALGEGLEGFGSGLKLNFEKNNQYGITQKEPLGFAGI